MFPKLCLVGNVDVFLGKFKFVAVKFGPEFKRPKIHERNTRSGCIKSTVSAI